MHSIMRRAFISDRKHRRPESNSQKTKKKYYVAADLNFSITGVSRRVGETLLRRPAPFDWPSIK